MCRRLGAISRIEALNFRCLRNVSQGIGPFHVLIGPNASGKTTFLDVVAFLGRLVADGPEAAVRERTADFRDIVTGRYNDRVELAVEARIPDRLVVQAPAGRLDTVRYEIALGIGDATGEVQILGHASKLTQGRKGVGLETSRCQNGP